MAEMICSHCGTSHEVLEPEVAVNCPECNFPAAPSANFFRWADELNRAEKARRAGAFHNACDIYTGILESEPGCIEAYWGRALSRWGILFEEGLWRESSVRCDQWAGDSFEKDPDVVRAVSLSGPEDEAMGIFYRSMRDIISNAVLQTKRTFDVLPPLSRW